jgi:general secretion pathway protein B
MSSILDALERAEEERGHGAKRALGIAPPVEVGSRIKLPLILSLIALLLVVILGFVWLSIERTAPPAKEENPSQAAPMVQETPAQAPPKVRLAPLPVEKPVLSVPDQLRRNALPSAKPLMDEAVVAKPPVRPVVPPPASKPAVVPESRIATARPAEKTMQPQPPEKPAVQADRIVERPFSAPVREEQAPLPVEPDMPLTPAEPEIPLVWELPQVEREKVLSLKSSVHVYSKDPAQRFVIINMHRYGEGDTLPPDGFRLERIDQDGVVIDYGGGLVRLLRR